MTGSIDIDPGFTCGHVGLLADRSNEAAVDVDGLQIDRRQDVAQDRRAGDRTA
jgi:hypothetical protein